MNYSEIVSIFGRLDKWRHLPAYQLERRADIFFAVFLPYVLNQHHLGTPDKEPSREIDYRLIPEFPLKRCKNNRSKKVDYLALSTDPDRRHAFVIELKTDSASFDEEQCCFLKNAVNRGMRKLLQDVKLIVKATNASKRGKYFHLLKELDDLGLIELPCSLKKIIYKSSRESFKCTVDDIKILPVPEPESLRLIYVMPTTKEEDVDVIDFSSFAEIIEKRCELGRVFACYLRRWAEIEPGSCKGLWRSYSESRDAAQTCP